ncbi:winged helix-turn-helix transcriptional regulator [Chitinophaga ginsengisoli]|uniref:HxlR family transcriptional regulator n=1 Tax=Chitinophaga ginsengisoli TaxID=363837 RepID=A0A2P8G5E0_9BACT|nr:helix-turn-helix domain-containing protein [Chitinophaga ginsengisoli]PSL29115.1 HxlR family transcriptional regulator [Chitinophaga ginsengisoli]
MDDVNCSERHTLSQCTRELKAIQDTMDVLNGKWKISIISDLRFGKKRFSDLKREVVGIGSKMLSKELQELEINGLIRRNVISGRPVIIEYEITDYGETLNPIIDELSKWGKLHRHKILGT